MSIKRSKHRSFSRRPSDEDSTVSFTHKPAEPEKTWEEHVAGQPEEAFSPYNLKSRFERGALLLHSKFGKGLITAVEDKRIEVLFSDGKKKLGHAMG
jgi:hypothetical protein